MPAGDSRPTPSPLGPRARLQVLVRHLAALVAELRDAHAPITTWLVGVTAVAFAGQVALAFDTGVSVRLVTGALFLEYPEATWVLSPVLHRDASHFAVNAALLALLGTVVEREFAPSRYLGFLLAAAAVSSALAFAVQAPFTDKHVAAYGASGLVFALATYSLRYTRLRLPRSLDGVADVLLGAPTPATRLAAVVGVSAVLLVVVDLLSAPYFAPNWVNGAHLGGALVGLLGGVRHPPRR